MKTHSSVSRCHRWLHHGHLWAGLIVTALTASAQSTWTDTDIGAVAAAGSGTESSGVVTVRGSGEDIWGTADEFHFRYIPWTGDGTFIVRVTNFTSTNVWAKAGIMLRADLSPGSAHVFSCTNGGTYPATIARTSGGASSSAPYAPQDEHMRSSPMWLRLSRYGSTIVTDFSADGLTWRIMSTATYALPASVYVGLAVSSHVDGSIATATFDNISLGTVAPNGLTAIPHAPNRVDLRWGGNVPNATGYEVERSTDNTSFARVGTTPASTVTFADTTASPATTYYYRVRATTASGPTPYSAAATVTTPPAPPGGWASRDVGAPNTSGSVNAAGGTFTVRGGGAGVGGLTFHHESTQKGDFSYTVPGYADAFQFCSQNWSGDGEVLARVASLSGGPAAQAGILMRAIDTTQEGSARNVFCHLVPGALVVTTRTGVTNASIGRSSFINETVEVYRNSSAGAPPTWLKLVRGNGGVMAYASNDGTNWTDLAWIKIDLGSATEYGLGVSNHDDTAAASAAFDNMTVRAVTTPIAPPPAPSNLAATSVGVGQASFSWVNNTTAYERIELERTAANGTVARFDAVGTTASDTTAEPGASYTYRARAVRGTLFSAYSNSVSVTMQELNPPTNLVATVMSPTQINLTWTDNSANEATTYVEVSLDGSTYSIASYGGANMTSFSHTGLTPGQRYWYKIVIVTGYPYKESSSSVVTATTPTGGSNTPTNLAATAVSPTQVNLTWTDNATDEINYQVERRNFGSSVFAVVATLGVNSASYSDSGVSQNSRYYYRVRAYNGSSYTSYSTEVEVTTPSGPVPPPSGWSDSDVGAVAAAGSSTTLAQSDFTVRGSGNDIWENSDEFHLMYQNWTGDGVFIVRVVGMDNTNGWAKAGLMVRESLAPGSRHVFVAANPGNAAALFSRPATNGQTDFALSVYEIASQYLKLTRTGDRFEAFQSNDATNWVQIGSAINVTMPAGVFVGLAVTSHNDGVLCAAHLQVHTIATPGGPPPPPPSTPAPPTGLMGSATATSVGLSWTDNSTNETSFAIERSSDNVTFAQIATTGGNIASYNDSSVAASTTYYYRVRAVNTAGASAPSNVINLTTPSAPPPTGSVWSSADVGAVAAAGSDTGPGGGPIYRVTGSGNDIWENSDEFHFMYQGWSGDGTFIARVNAIDNTNGWAKAGVMLRETLAAGARHVFIGVNPNRSAGLFSRATFNGTTDFSFAVYEMNPMWVKLERSGTTFRAYQSSDGTNWVAIGSALTLNLPTTVLAGLAVTSHNDGVLCSASFDNVSFSGGSAPPPPPPPPPSGTWLHGDIGAVGVAGSDDANTTTNTYTVRGSGSDIWDSADAFRFLYQARSGNCTVEADLTSLTNTNDWAKAGVMIRESLAANARNAFLCATPSNGVGAQSRTATGGGTTWTAGPWGAAIPRWLRLARNGDQFTASTSSDGATWTTVETFTISMNADIYVGFAVTSHSNSTLATGTFGEPSIR